MTKLITPSKNEYQLQIGLNTLHAETIEWLSEIEFGKTELSFLNKLLDKYFLRIEDTARLSALFDLDKRLKGFKLNDLKLLHKVMVMHENRLDALDENMFSQDEQMVRDEHATIKLKAEVFTDNIKKIKREIFDFVEREIIAVGKRKIDLL